MSFNVFGKKQVWGPGRYGQVQVDINELAGKIANDFVEAGERSKQEQREANAKYQYTGRKELYTIARKHVGGYTLETIEPIDSLGVMSGRGNTIEIAKCDLRFNLMRRLLDKKAAKTMPDAAKVIAGWDVYVADVIGETKVQATVV